MFVTAGADLKTAHRAGFLLVLIKTSSVKYQLQMKTKTIYLSIHPHTGRPRSPVHLPLLPMIFTGDLSWQTFNYLYWAYNISFLHFFSIFLEATMSTAFLL